jgi:hypothetical protein
MGINMTLLLNIAAIGCAAGATSIVNSMPLVALALAFAAGVAVTISSHYAFICDDLPTNDTTTS